MLELDHKEGWVLKNWCFRTVVLEKTLESPLDCKEIQPVHPKGNHPWIFMGRTDAEAETPILWPPDAKSWLTGKDPGAGKDLGQKKKVVTEDEMAGWHLLTQWTWIWANSGRQWRTGKPVCCGPRGNKESDMTKGLNNDMSYAASSRRAHSLESLSLGLSTSRWCWRSLRESLLAFSKLGDVSMVSRNLSCLKTEKPPCLGKSRFRQIEMKSLTAWKESDQKANRRRSNSLAFRDPRKTWHFFFF